MKKLLNKNVLILLIAESILQVISFTSGNSQFTNLLYSQGFTPGNVYYLGVASTVGAIAIYVCGIIVGNKLKSTKKWVIVSYFGYFFTMAKSFFINNFAIPLSAQVPIIISANFLSSLITGIRFVFIYRLSLSVMDDSVYGTFLPVQTIVMGFMSIICSSVSALFVAKFSAKFFINLNLAISLTLTVYCIISLSFIKCGVENTVPPENHSFKTIIKELAYPMLIPDILKQFGFAAAISSTIAMSVVYGMNDPKTLAIIDFCSTVALFSSSLFVKFTFIKIKGVLIALLPLAVVIPAGLYFSGIHASVLFYAIFSFAAYFLLYFFGTATPLIWTKKVDKSKMSSRSSAIQLVTNGTAIAASLIIGKVVDTSFYYLLYIIGAACLLIAMICYVKYVSHEEDKLF